MSSSTSRYLSPKVPGGLLTQTGKEFTPTEELILQQLGDISYVTGDIIYFNGLILTRLGIGSSTNVLTVSGGVPAWGAAPSFTILAPTSGAVDDSNTAFVYASKPKEIVVNGLSYRENNGWTWNSGTSTATLASPVGVGGDTYARV